jgi:predicted hotdog family 3-hydroxylacyl-ACP dehydratase
MSYPAIQELLPQRGDMLLLDRVLEAGDEYILTEVTVRGDCLFADAGREVPAWVGIEYMAQTVAAFSGYQRLLGGRAVDLGFLLGTRYYRSVVTAFPCGALLRVRAEMEIEGLNGLSVFACRIESGELLAQAKLSVFLPSDSRAYLKEKGL